MARVLITSALPYINGVKHLGNLVGSMLPADVYARFERQRRGRDKVLFVCATDEHGTPAELAALEEGLPVADYCAKWHAIQHDLGRRFGLSFDHFGRSSSAENRRLTQDFARTLWERGYIEERTTRQVYSHADGRFLPDRYVIGTCPHCGYDRARGDQCENCTRVLDPVDLLSPRSAVSGSTAIEIRPSTHLFLRQSLFVDRLRAWIDSKDAEWPVLVTSIARKWLDEGLQDRGITRDLEWGVPVEAADWGPAPDGRRADAAGLAGKVFYVWFDAPIEYIGATAEWAAAAAGRDWQSWWQGGPARDVTYVQFMGKDNVPFHTVGFPCTLMGVNEGLPEHRQWKLVDALKGFNWLTYYGGKFSTSQKRGVFMDTALELLPADCWRWYLIAQAPESGDSSFTWEHFAATVNKDLADVLGNFVNRLLKFTQNRFEGLVPAGGAWGAAEAALVAALEARVAAYTAHLEAFEFRKAMAELRAVFVLGNEYLTHAAPWTRIKTDPVGAGASVRLGLNLIALLAEWTAPVMPETAARLLASVGGRAGDLGWPGPALEGALDRLTPGTAILVPDLLFKKIEDSQVALWKARFGGEA